MPKNAAFGTTLTWDGEVVAGLSSINGVEIKVDTVEVTAHDSTDGFKEFLPTLLDAGEVTAEGFFNYSDTAGQQAMVTDMLAKSTKTAVITFPSATGTTWTFTGFITTLKIGDASVDGAIPFSVAIKVTGKPTFAVAAVVGMSGIGFDNDVLMMPAFAIGTYEYVVTITNGQTATIITPVDATAGEVITITSGGASQVVATGVASTAIPVSASAMTDIVVTISKTACAPKSYTFHCAVLAS